MANSDSISSQSTLSTHGTATPQPMEDAAWEGNRLIVRRGGDVSFACFCCGGKTQRRITCHLRRRNSGVFNKSTGSTSGSSLLLILDLIELVLFVLMFLTDLPAAKRRELTYGLCARHVKIRWLMLLSLPMGLLLGVGLFTFVFTDLSAPMYLGLPASILGLGSLMAGPFIYAAAPGPTLDGENENYVWVKGAAKSFLQKYPQAQPKPTSVVGAKSPADQAKK